MISDGCAFASVVHHLTAPSSACTIHMPVTFAVADHGAKPVSLPQGTNGSHTAREVLELACEAQAQTAGEILQSSLTDARGEPERKLLHRLLPFKKSKAAKDTVPAPQAVSNVIPTRNGLVDTVILAYNKHHALVLRPDDVWLAILAQFNFYVNANSELLRASFVAHEGKRELKVTAEGTRNSFDFGEMSRQMVDQLHKNVVDPSLRAWVLPKFTTTTANDTTVAAIVMMATLKAYFEYVYSGWACGIPRVTLEGTKSDWEDILGRLEKLKEYSLQTIAWYHLLVPVISRFIKSFDEPESAETVKFWQQVAHYEPGFSGPSYYTGWINAFCVFDEKGRWKGHPLRMNLECPEAPDTLSAEDFHAKYIERTDWKSGKLNLVLDHTPFHQVVANDTPSGYAEVDVKLEEDQGQTFPCALTAGLIGTRISSSEDKALSQTGENDTVRPLPGWWMYVKKEPVRVSRYASSLH
ncbi:hypothetical protein FB451DRAFT_1094666 [Mycena latifolia]|nr:hypothetical protein FB451DRAFT_1094666 [Mycena latifolia]